MAFFSFCFPVEGSVKCVIVFQSGEISLVFTNEILYKTFVLRSISVEELKVWEFCKAWQWFQFASPLTLQSPNFSRPLSRNFFRLNAQGNVLGTSLVKFVWSLTKLLLHYTSTAKEYVEVYLRPGKNVSLS